MSWVSQLVDEIENIGFVVFDPATETGLENMIDYLKDMGYTIVPPEKE